MAAPWTNLVPNDEGVFAHLLGDQRPTSAFDSDGKPRVPASGPGNPYPDYETNDVPASAYDWIVMRDYLLDNPKGAALEGLQRAGDIAMAAGQTGGPPGAIAMSLGKLLKTPMAWSPGHRALAAAEVAPKQAAEAMEAERLAKGYQQFVKRFEPQTTQAISYDRLAPVEALKDGGMIVQRPSRGGGYGAVVPEADPARIAAAQREAEAIEKGRFRLGQNAKAAEEAQSTTVQNINMDASIDETMQRWLGAVADRTGTPPDSVVRALAANGQKGVPGKGQYERFVANEPGLQMLMQQYGMTMDDLVTALARRQYAVPARSPDIKFNGNVMQQFEKGRVGAIPMTEAEKAFRDALQRIPRNIPPRGGSTFD